MLSNNIAALQINPLISLTNEEELKERLKCFLKYPAYYSAPRETLKYQCITCKSMFFQRKELLEHRKLNPKCLKAWRERAKTPTECPNLGCTEILIGAHNLEKHLYYHCHRHNVYKKYMDSTDRRKARNVGAPLEDEEKYRDTLKEYDRGREKEKQKER